MTYPANAAYPVAYTDVRGLAYPRPLKHLFGFSDTSYGNDMADSAMWACPEPKTGRLVGYRLWIDYADPAKREMEEARYVLIQCPADAMAHVLLMEGSGTLDSVAVLVSEAECLIDTATVLETEDPEDVLGFLKTNHPSITIYAGSTR
jgi:hypothetical protein